MWGEILWDRFPDGDQLGGAPANVAWHLGQRGAHAILVSRVGDDADGRRAIARLGEKVDVSLIQVDPERATGEVLIDLDAAGEPRYRLVPGRAWEGIAVTAGVRTELAGAAAVVYGTLAQRTAEALAGWRALIAASPPGCLRVCDPNLRPDHLDPAVVAEALAVADVIKLNTREVDQLRHHLRWDDPVGRLRDHARVVALTRGADGSTLYAADQVIEIPGVAAAPGGDSVGCGDAYLAVLVQGLVTGGDLEQTGIAASAWAARVAGCRGATPDLS